MSSRAPEPLPQQHPFRLVERTEEDGRGRVAVVLGTAGGATTRVASWPATLIAEAMAQAILLVVRPSRPGELRLAGLDRVEVFHSVIAGDRVEVEVEEVGAFGALRRYRCRAARAGAPVAAADVTVSG